MIARDDSPVRSVWIRGSSGPDHMRGMMSIDSVNRALVVLSSDGARDEFLGAWRAAGLVDQIAAKRDLVNETLCVYRVHA